MQVPAHEQADAEEAVDADAIEELADEIATIAAHIHAATHRLLVLIAEFDRVRGWKLAGYSNCARWLATRTGIDLGTAREKVRAARALVKLPLTSAARERERYRSRTFSVFPDDDGMYVVTGRLMPEVGALLLRAIEAASDALFRERRTPGLPDDSSLESEASQRRADAVGLVVERALAAGFGGVACGCIESEVHDPEPACRCVETDLPDHERACRCSETDVADREPSCRCVGGDVPASEKECGHSSADAPISGTRAERYQVVLHVDPDTLAAEGEPDRSELEDGTRVSPETARRLSCDASVIHVSHAKDGSILEMGRKTRTISPALRRALEVRDRGCRFPGCHLRFTDAHHVRHWSDGGETGLSNCLLLCRFHHTLVHEGGWHVAWWGQGRPVFYDPRGGTHFAGRWKPPTLPERPVAALVREHRLRGIEPNGLTAGARWERERDIPDSVYFRALEAL